MSLRMVLVVVLSVVSSGVARAETCSGLTIRASHVGSFPVLIEAGQLLERRSGVVPGGNDRVWRTESEAPAMTWFERGRIVPGDVSRFRGAVDNGWAWIRLTPSLGGAAVPGTVLKVWLRDSWPNCDDAVNLEVSDNIFHEQANGDARRRFERTSWKVETSRRPPDAASYGTDRDYWKQQSSFDGDRLELDDVIVQVNEIVRQWTFGAEARFDRLAESREERAGDTFGVRPTEESVEINGVRRVGSWTPPEPQHEIFPDVADVYVGQLLRFRMQGSLKILAGGATKGSKYWANQVVMAIESPEHVIRRAFTILDFKMANEHEPRIIEAVFEIPADAPDVFEIHSTLSGKTKASVIYRFKRQEKLLFGWRYQ